MKDMMSYKGYLGSVHFDDDALIFYGKVEFIRALVSYEATTAKSLRRSFEGAVNDYLETCKFQDVDPEVPFKGSLNIRLGPELHRKIAVAAASHDMSVNKFIKDTLVDVVQ